MNVSKFHKFHGIFLPGTRESAYLWALSSAGAAWGIATACAQGWLPDCSCNGRDELKKSWEWGGCSYGVQFGIVTSRKLLTRSANSRSPLRKLEKHNLKAGRLVCFFFHFPPSYYLIIEMKFMTKYPTLTSQPYQFSSQLVTFALKVN